MIGPSTFMRALVLDMAEHPEDYFDDGWGHTIDHRKSGLRIWIGNGFPSYGIYAPTKVSFSLADKFAFHRARKLWAQASTMAKFQTMQKETSS